RKLFDSYAVDDETTCKTIRQVYEETEEVLDPHTAIGVQAARECRRDISIPMVTLATAHPVKFPEAVEKAGIGVNPQLPHHLADLFERKEAYDVVPNELKAIHDAIRQKGIQGR